MQLGSEENVGFCVGKQWLKKKQISLHNVRTRKVTSTNPETGFE
jgi:hypothetical protein